MTLSYKETKEKQKKIIIDKIDIHMDELLNKGYGEIHFIVMAKRGLITMIKYILETSDIIE